MRYVIPNQGGGTGRKKIRERREAEKSGKAVPGKGRRQEKRVKQGPTGSLSTGRFILISTKTLINVIVVVFLICKSRYSVYQPESDRVTDII